MVSTSQHLNTLTTCLAVWRAVRTFQGKFQIKQLFRVASSQVGDTVGLSPETAFATDHIVDATGSLMMMLMTGSVEPSMALGRQLSWAQCTSHNHLSSLAPRRCG